MNFIRLSFILILFLNTCEIKASKILFIMAAGTKSHKIFYNGVIKALAGRNHQITMISPFAPFSEIANVREIVLINNFVEKVISNAFTTSNFDNAKKFVIEGPKGCVDSMEEEAVRKVLEEEFDLFILPFSMSDCYLPYIYSKKVPFIYTFPNIISGPYADMLGTLDIPSVSPLMTMESHFPLTFGGRMKSTLYSFITYYVTMYYGKRIEDELSRRGLSVKESPPIWELQKNASLAILNSFQALEDPQRPYCLNIVFAGGIHIEPKGSLTKDLKKWMDDAGEEGFILFSLGTYAKPSHMKEEHRKIILKVFSNLKLKVLWKWDGQMDNLPTNVKVVEWIPQQGVLAHPNIRLFITHGGLLSTQESTYFGVPVIGMPIFADQHNNIAQVMSHGWGKKVDWKNLSEEGFKKVIVESLEDESLKKIVTERSRIMKDLQQTPSEEVVYWVEYVLRHRGAYHLQSPLRNMSSVEIYNIDVWSTVIIIFILTLLLTVYIFCKIIFVLFNSFKKPRHKKVKKQ